MKHVWWAAALTVFLVVGGLAGEYMRKAISLTWNSKERGSGTYCKCWPCSAATTSWLTRA